MKKPFAKWLALLGPAGLVPIAPATAGSALVTVIAFYTPRLPLPLWPALAAWFGLLVVGTLIAVWAAGEAEHELGHDAKPICIDEAVGQVIALLLVPHTVAAFATAFVLFRVFDVIKPFGAREIQDLPGGWGVVMDDVVAGIVACVAFHALRFGLARFGIYLLG
jgi:phosphatidylglycerophosphatase A